MTARVAVYQRLLADTALQGMGINSTRLLTYPVLVEPPKNGLWLLLRWEESRLTAQDFAATHRTAMVERLTVLGQLPRVEGNDYNLIIQALLSVQQSICTALQVAGTDGGVFSQGRFVGDSGDLVDPGFNTIVKSKTFEINGR